jgi:hypothetical protein
MHGEVIFLPWEYAIEEDRVGRVRVRFWVETRRTPFLLERTLELSEDTAALSVRETVHNTGASKAHFVWGHHITLGGGFLNEHCVIDLPPCTTSKDARYDSEHSRVAPCAAGSATRLAGKDGKAIDVTRVLPMGSRVNEMLFLTGFEDAWCAVTDREKQVGFAVSWDKAMFPCMWLWQEYNAIETFPFYGRGYAMAFEPQTTTVPMLGDAHRAGTARVLDAGEAATTWVTASVFHGSHPVSGVSRDGTVRLGG